MRQLPIGQKGFYYIVKRSSHIRRKMSENRSRAYVSEVEVKTIILAVKSTIKSVTSKQPSLQWHWEVVRPKLELLKETQQLSQMFTIQHFTTEPANSYFVKVLEGIAAWRA